ncbi:MAG: bacillithiol biosynthesis BshC [Planctomycetes bacterium]|nr:bacillithiol biosynthesis BshC [Planctomycetota bacterium]MCB9916798.1 bacillithiol biosynthesis BshC [Planctomycetota bacterium]
MRIVRNIEFSAYGLPSIFTGWIDGAANLESFLPPLPRRIEDVALEAEGRRHRGLEIAHRVEVLTAIRESLEARFDDIATPLGLHQEQQRALDVLSRPGALAIVTGQQPCVFGGPLFVAHKVATALRLARDLRAHGVPDVVTIFWNHDEDHDWGEANQVAFVNPALDVQSVRLRLPSSGLATGRFEVATALERAVHEARDLIVQTPWGLEELDHFLPRSAHETVATTTTRMLSRHFGCEGLLVLEATRLPASTRAILRDWHDNAASLRRRTQDTASELVDRGHDVTVDPEQALLLSIAEDGRRRAVPDGEPCPPTHLSSAGVLLRSVWQDRLLPTLAYVAGPGEIAYHALTGALYDACSVVRPLLVPRASIVLTDPRTLDLLERFALDVPELRDGVPSILERVVERFGDDGETSGAQSCSKLLRAEARAFRERLRELESTVEAIDRFLVHPLHRIASKTAAELGRLADKVERQKRNRSGRLRQHVRRLCAELAPRGSLQERVLPLLPFVARGGSAFARKLCDVTSPFVTGDDAMLAKPAQRVVLWTPEAESDAVEPAHDD